APARVVAAPKFELPADFFATRPDTTPRAPAPVASAPAHYAPPQVTQAAAPAQTMGGVTVIKSPALLAAERAGRIAQ
ncbi:MAG: dihydrolipoamide succinyltransferase, partial [Alphaproteobacteria bacterium]|nr:dihydrolipoamide succinyltransferase [Alphaproteobacteria bacterium]